MGNFLTARKLLLAVSVLGAAAPGLLRAAAVDTDQYAQFFDPGIKLPDRDSDELQHARADQWRLVGKTLFVKGNVYVPYGNMIIRADQAMIDLDSRDIEAQGNVRMSAIVTETAALTMDELERLQMQSRVSFEIVGQVIDPLGNRKIKVEVSSESSTVTADRVSGNLVSGYLHFTKLRMRLKTFVCKAERGTRQPGGELKLENIELSSCVYLEQDQEHYSVKLATANLYPHETEGYGFAHGEANRNEYSLWGYNGTVHIYGVPVLWLPMFYKPKDESPGLFSMQLGKSGDWGYYMMLSRKFQISDSPYAEARLMLDWYTLRGLGYGVSTWIDSSTSKTMLRGYGIYDLRPYESSGVKPGKRGKGERWKIPHQRFDFQLTHLTHLSPRLDFRGQVEWLSDPYMLDDYFSARANSISQPASYAALEYQGDRFSASLYTRFRVNYFSTTVQKLPEFRLDVPRQEILPGTNLYYQGSHTAAYMMMKWADFDRKPRNPRGKLDDYQSGRFDSVNFLYYPLRLSFINIVPRAGLRLTGYTNSSKTKITSEDVYRMQVAANSERDYGMAVKNYDDRGGGQFRMVAEFGVEANTKIYRTWENVRNAFWELDGLRHVAEPYINYTFIPKPTVNREHLYYFDDIDRIRDQNFLRIGLRNRLQTRTGAFGSESVREWFSMENYWDVYFNNEENYNHIGDFCTKLTFSPFKQLTITGFVQIDAGQNQDHDVEAQRGGRKAGRPGIGGTFLNRAYLRLTYRPIEDLVFNFSYNYKDAYNGRAAYSMGSTLTEIESGSVFDQYYSNSRTQTLNFGVSAPLTPDRRTFGAYKISYDFEEGAITKQTLSLSRLFHCVKLSGEVTLTRSRDDDDRKVSYDTSFSVMATLVGLEDPINAVRRKSVQAFTGLN